MVSGEKKTGLVKAALWHAAHGFPVFPLHSALGGVCSCGELDSQNPGKHSRTVHCFKDATQDQERIAACWQQWPDANIGIPTGATSGLLVVDCDLRNSGQADRSELIKRCGPISDNKPIRDLAGETGVCLKARHARASRARQMRFQMAGACERANLQAALVILAERARYLGLPLTWAEAVLRGERQSAAGWLLVP